MSRCSTVAVYGHFGSPNLGNEATLAAFLYNLRRRAPDVSFLGIAPAQNLLEQAHGLPHIDTDPLPIGRSLWRVRPVWLQNLLADGLIISTEAFRRRQAARRLAGIKALLVPGTGVFDDFGQGALDTPLHLDRWTSAAKSIGAPVAFLSVGAGRVSDSIGRYLFARSLRRADYCSFRDCASIAAAKELGVTRDYPVCADLAFGLPEELRGIESARWPPRTIGVGVMGYFGWNETDGMGRRIYREYLAKVVDLVRWIVLQKLEVVLLIGDTRADHEVRSDVLKRLSGTSVRDAEGRVQAPPVHDYVELVQQIKRCDLVVATRFHNVLLSLWLSRPVISIGYDRKNDELMAQAGLSRFSHSIERFTVADIEASIRELLREGGSLIDSVGKYCQQQRIALERQYDSIICGFDLLRDSCSRTS